MGSGRASKAISTFIKGIGKPGRSTSHRIPFSYTDRMTPPRTPPEDDSLLLEPVQLTGTLISYARVSTTKQNVDCQMAALTGSGCLRIFFGKKPVKNVKCEEL